MNSIHDQHYDSNDIELPHASKPQKSIISGLYADCALLTSSKLTSSIHGSYHVFTCAYSDVTCTSQETNGQLVFFVDGMTRKQ